MIEHMQNHLLSELERAARADTVFVVGSVLFNILALFVSWAISGSADSSRQMAILLIFMAGTTLFTLIALVALDNGRKMHATYHAALMQLYQDTNVAKYYPAEASGTAILRTRLYMVAVLASGFLAISVPLLSI